MLQVHQLLTTITQAKAHVHSLTQKSGESQSSSFWAQLFDMSNMNTTSFDSYDDLDKGGADLRKLAFHLDQAADNLCNIFQVIRLGS